METLVKRKTMDTKKPTKKQTLGQQGEDIAYKYLLGAGYMVIDRNYRKPWGELDIVCLAANKELVLVEVKTVSGDDPLVSAENQMSMSKMEKFKRVAQIYANNYLKNKDDSIGFRLDLVAINIVDGKAYLKHYKNIS